MRFKNIIQTKTMRSVFSHLSPLQSVTQVRTGVLTISIYFFQNFFHGQTKIKTLKHDVSEEPSSFLRPYC
jgi:hypothetical protein